MLRSPAEVDNVNADIETNVFKRTQMRTDKLLAYGFEKNKAGYVLEKKFLDNAFLAHISINFEGVVQGEVIETATNEAFEPLRVESMNKGYAGKVRAAYVALLEEIRHECFMQTPFATPQANRLAARIHEKYADAPHFPWEKYEGFGVFKNPDNGKWYGLIMNIDRTKLDPQKNGKTDVMNLKLPPEQIEILTKQKGFYKAYHMNKKYWITALLDDSLDDKTLEDLIETSHQFTLNSKRAGKTNQHVWLVPANPSFFDIIGAFQKKKCITWKQSGNIKAGDTAYMYVGAPYSAVMFKCEVLKTDMPYHYQDKNLTINKVMEIKLIQKFKPDLFPLAFLKTFGVTSIRCQRTMPEDLLKVLEKA